MSLELLTAEVHLGDGEPNPLNKPDDATMLGREIGAFSEQPVKPQPYGADRHGAGSTIEHR